MAFGRLEFMSKGLLQVPLAFVFLGEDFAVKTSGSLQDRNSSRQSVELPIPGKSVLLARTKVLLVGGLTYR